MPYKGSRRKKRKTQKAAGPAPSGDKPPTSLVIRRGHVDSTVRALIQDVRRMMLPHTAQKLRERRANTLRDFIDIAGPLGVSHFLMFSETPSNVVLRVGRTPRGPTLTFRVSSFALSHHIKAAQARPVEIEAAYETPPLVVLHGFNSLPADAHVVPPGAAGVSLADALKMTMVTFQNMFPSINPATVKLASCRRVVLLHFDKDTRTLELRHYLVQAAPVGVSKAIKKVVAAPGRHAPDLSRFGDIADFVLRGKRGGGGGGAGSDSEGEDDAARVTLPQDFAGRGNVKSQQSAVKLAEVGPRLQLQLVKIEGGLCGGDVLYHAFVSKTKAQAEELKARAAAREALKAQRRAEQEANVAKKEEAKAAKKAAKEERKAARQAAAVEAAKDGKLGDEDEEEEDKEEDDEEGEEVEDDGGDDDGAGSEDGGALSRGDADEIDEEDDGGEEDGVGYSDDDDEEGEDEDEENEEEEDEEEEDEEEGEEEEEEEAPPPRPLAGTKRPAPSGGAAGRLAATQAKLAAAQSSKSQPPAKRARA